MPLSRLIFRTMARAWISCLARDPGSDITLVRTSLKEIMQILQVTTLQIKGQAKAL